MILLIVGVVIFFKLWEDKTRRKLLKKFKPEDDRARKGGVNFGQGEGREPDVENTTDGIERQRESERQESIQTTDVVKPRKAISSTRSNRPNIRDIIRRARERRTRTSSN